MIPNLVVLGVAAAGLLWAYARPRGFLVAFIASMFVLPQLFFHIGVALGAEGRYLSFLMIFAGASLATFLYRVAAGSFRAVTADLLPALYLAAVLAASVKVRGGGLDTSYLALFTRTAVVPFSFYYAGRMFFAETTAFERLGHGIRLAVGVAAGFYFLEFALRYNVFVDVSAWLVRQLGTEAFSAYVPQLGVEVAGFYRPLGTQVESTESAMVFLVGLAIIWGASSGRKMSWPSRWLALLCAAAIVLSTTRGVIIAMLAAGGAWWLAKPEARRGMIVVAAAGAGALVLLWSQLESSAVVLTRILNLETILGRIGAYLYAWQLFLSSPWLGVGVGTPVYALYEPGSDAFTVHSLYLDSLVHTGLLGTALLLLLYSNVLVLARRLRRSALDWDAGLRSAFLLLVVAFGVAYIANPEKMLPSALIWLLAGGVVTGICRLPGLRNDPTLGGQTLSG